MMNATNNFRYEEGERVALALELTQMYFNAKERASSVSIEQVLEIFRSNLELLDREETELVKELRGKSDSEFFNEET